MRHIDKDFLSAVEKCQWFENCGKDYDTFDFEVIYVKSEMEMMHNITKHKWEDLTLMKRNDLGFYLFKNHSEWYQHKWNPTVDEIKELYLNVMFDKYIHVFKETDTIKKVLDDVRWNVLLLFMRSFFLDCYHDDFFDRMEKIYFSGHIPCGWQGTLKDGKFLVY